MVSRDVIWVTFESTRQDHTSLDEHSRNTTPYLTELATDGTAFKQCYSHDIWTRSSSASILSGLAPSAHRTWSDEAKLPKEITTIPEAFRDAGYRTACISPNPQLSPSTGLDRGFDHFHHLIKSTLIEEAGLSTFLRWLLNLRRHSGGFTRDGRQHCIGYLSTQIAKRHIDAAVDSGDSLFLYLHHGDSHHAYVPPITWRDRFAEDLPMPIDDGINLAVEMSKQLHEFIAQDHPFTDDEWQTLRVLYDTSIAYVDYLTGTLVEYARQQLDDPIIIVTADHGELFGESGLLAHMLVANTAVSHVPLVVSGLDELPNGGLIQHADVMKMICTDLGVSHSIPVGQDVREQHRQFAVTQRGGARARKKLEKINQYNDAFPADEFHREDLTSIRTSDWRYQFSEEGAELFDPVDETTDVSDTYPTVADRLDELSQVWLNDVGQPVGKADTAEFDDEMTGQLRDLGYLQ